MKALRFSNDDIDAVSKLVELHLRFHGYGSGEWTDSAVRRYVRDAGDQLERLHVLTRADCTTRNQRKAERLRRTYDDLEARIARLSRGGGAGLHPARPRRQPDHGDPRHRPGREVGEAYKFLLELRMDNGPMTEADARPRCSRLVGRPVTRLAERCPGVGTWRWRDGVHETPSSRYISRLPETPDDDPMQPRPARGQPSRSTPRPRRCGR